MASRGARAVDSVENVRRPGAGQRQPREDFTIIKTRPSADFVKQGTIGNEVQLVSNYFEMTSRPDFHLLQYRVDFKPDIEHTGVKKALIRVHENSLGKYVFDGTLLYAVKRLPQPLELASKLRSDNSDIFISFRLIKEIQKDDSVYNMVINIILRRCLAMLRMTEIRRDYYDLEAAEDIPQHNLSVAPGYFTSIRFHENGFLLGVEVVHKLLRKDTALDVMDKVRRETRGDFQGEVRAALEGQIVMTHYNKKTYRIDEVDFDQTPMSKFHLRKEDREVTFFDYYNSRYHANIRNKSQPLLVSRPTRKDLNRGDDKPIFLIPELCGMTGLSEEQRKNFTLMKDVGAVTKVNPDRRVASLMRFRKRLADTPEIAAELNSWGIGFANQLVRVPARVLPPKTIPQYQAQPHSIHQGDWSRLMQRNRYAVSVELHKWLVVFPTNMGRQVQAFVKAMQEVGIPHNFRLPDPKFVAMQSDRNNDYTRTIQEECNKTDQIQMIMAVQKSNRADTYSAIKQLTLVDLGIPSQVLTGRILNNERQMMSVATKVTIQVASKLGAEPWRLTIPNTKWMVCGFDVYHDRRQSRAVGAFVASTNPSFTRYYSSVNLHKNNEEISPSFRDHVLRALRSFYDKNNNQLPDKIIVYRDGLGSGDIARVKETEIAAIREACRMAASHAKSDVIPTVAFIIVTKRINTRFFTNGGRGYNNPECGTVVDDKVTLSERYDFFLISQKTSQGTVSPTSYNIVEDDTGIKPDIHQRLANSLTDLYWNWPGSLRLPGPVQYAHKLAYLVGEKVMRKPHEGLADLPYYL